MKHKVKSKPGFWKELKRRGVPRVLAMYAATAFIVIEASDIIFPRLGLPDWTVTFLIVLLIAIRAGHQVTWDPKAGQVINDPQTNRLYVREMRSPYELQ